MTLIFYGKHNDWMKILNNSLNINTIKNIHNIHNINELKKWRPTYIRNCYIIPVL